MTVRLRIAAAIAASAALLSAIFFGTAAAAAEGALHPRRIAVAPVCPCIAHTNCGDASITAPDGVILRAWFYRPEVPNGAAIVIFHGIGSSREDSVALGNVFLKAGYSVLEPDLRGHGSSGGFTSYGLLEEQDVHAWAGWMLAHPGISRIYGFGASLGGSVLLEALDRDARFRGVIAESAYSAFPDIARERMERAAPAGLKWLAGPFVDSGLLWARLRYAVDLRNASALGAVRRTHVPVFLIHGLADDRTSPENSRRLAAANPGVTTLWLSPLSGHANVRATEGKAFESRVLTWLSEH